MTGIDGYNWSVFGGNPVPGDPDAVRAIASHFADLADTADSQNGLLRAAGTNAQSIWVGPAATKFHPHVTKVSGQIDKLVASHRDAADALNGYWPALQAAQQQAVTALAKAQAATTAQASAQSQLTSAQSAASSASSQYNTASTALASNPSPQPTDVSHVQSLQGAYQSAQQAVSSASGAVAAAGTELAAAHAMKDAAVAAARKASSVAASALNAASAAGIQNPHESFLSGLADDLGITAAVHWVEGAASWAEGHWELLVPGGLELVAIEDGVHWMSQHWVSVLKDASAALGGIATVAGVLSLIPGVGEIALPVAIAASLLGTADDSVLAATGHGSWETVGFDAVGDLGFGAGEALSFAGRGMETAGDLTEASERLTAQNAHLASDSSELESASARWSGMADDPVFVVGSDGSTEMTKGADLALQTSSDAASRTETLNENLGTLASNNEKLADLPGDGPLNPFKYSLRTFQPSEDAGTLTRMKSFFQNPVEYSNTVLHPATLPGEDAPSLSKLISGESKEMFTGAGRVPYRIAVGVGVGGSALGGYADVGAWQDALSKK